MVNFEWNWSFIRYRPSYNVAPGFNVPVVRRDDEGGGDGVVSHCMKWGLVPSFTKKTDKIDHFRMVMPFSSALIFSFCSHLWERAMVDYHFSLKATHAYSCFSSVHLRDIKKDEKGNSWLRERESFLCVFLSMFLAVLKLSHLFWQITVQCQVWVDKRKGFLSSTSSQEPMFGVFWRVWTLELYAYLLVCCC